jgi:hypothetical protein
MRIFFLFMMMMTTFDSFSQQKDAVIRLNPGQKFSVQTTISQEADMGMGMEMKNFTNSQSKFIVIGADDKSYTISNTLTGLKVNMEFMGQQSTYDSDLKEDSASEIGKSIKNLNIPDTIVINKYSGYADSNKKTSVEPKEAGSNPMDALFESLGEINNTDAAISEAFFIIPAGKKTNESWIDSVSTKDQKSTKTYTIQSIVNNIATISLNGNVESNLQTETQGLQVSVSLNTKTKGEIIADTKTSLVSKRTTNATITGTLELMGQSAPITGTATSTSVYEY